MTAASERPYTTDEIRRFIAHEKSGDYGSTYHYCDCGRDGCRRLKCARCWEEELAAMLKEEGEK